MVMHIRAGVLSDTHLSRMDTDFKARTGRYFAGCDVIIHAGDLTDAGILAAFAGKTVYAVSGNMCSAATRDALPGRRVFQLGAFTIALAHGAEMGLDIEDRLWTLFPEANCIIYGHTHRACCHRQGGILFLNPGSFRAGGSYAILEAGETLQASVHSVDAAA